MTTVTSILLSVVDVINSSGSIGIVLFIALYSVACIFMVPKSLLTLSAGFLYGPVYGVAIALLGCTMGASSAFLCGRYLIRPIVTKQLASDKFTTIDRAITARGASIVFLMRLSPLFPFGLINYACSMTSISLITFALISCLGMLPATVLYAYAGSLANSLLTLTDNTMLTDNIYLTWLGIVVSIAVALVMAHSAQSVLKAELKK